MIGTVCIAAAVLGLCARVRRSLERNRLFRRDLAGGRVRIAPLYNQGAGFGALPLSARQMAPLSLAALWALVFVMIRRFEKVDATAAKLQWPYLVWLTFAGYLNLGVWILN